jgi:arylsulfatase A-like enzyme
MQSQLMSDGRRGARLGKVAIDALGLGTALALVDALLAIQLTDWWGRLVANPVGFGRSIVWLSLTYALGVLAVTALIRNRARVPSFAVVGIVLGPGAFWLTRTARGWELLLSLVALAAAGAALGLFTGWCVRRSPVPLRIARALAASLAVTAVVSYVGPRSVEPDAVGAPWPTPSTRANREVSRRPNIVLFILDTVRPDHLAPYGYAFIATPNLSRLADEGTLFETAVAQAPITSVSHASIFTGLLPMRHGLRSFESQLAEKPDVVPLAAHLKAAGFVTAAIVASAALSPFYGLDAGFDIYHQIESDFFYPFRSCPSAVLAWALDEVGIVPNRNTYRPYPLITNDALRFLDAYADRPFFLWVHYFDAHSPYGGKRAHQRKEHHPGRSSLDRFRLTYRYDSEIVGVDAGVGRVIETLEARGLLDRTIVAVVADHGEGLGEHSYVGHARRVYEEQLRIPLILRYPDRIPAGRRVDTQVRGIDLMPTLLELAEVPVPPGLDGESLMPFLDARGRTPDRFSFSEVMMDGDRIHLLAASDGRYKLIRDRAGRIELFDLDSDPGEEIDLSEELPAIREALMASLDAYLATANDAGLEDNKPELDDSLHDQLRALGYMQ